MSPQGIGVSLPESGVARTRKGFPSIKLDSPGRAVYLSTTPRPPVMESVMRGWLRLPADLLQWLGQLLAVLVRIADSVTDRTDVAERVEALERSRALWEAEMEGRQVKLDSTFKSVRAAEERLRHAERRRQEIEEPDDEADAFAAFQAARDAANGAHVAGGESAGVLPVRPRLGTRAAAADRKWGRG